VRCVAVAVHDFTAQIVGALGISGPVWRLSIQVLQTKTELVKEAARRLSRDLGYCGQTAADAPGKVAESV
jgi:DNA-binding IclR family transcriptional regulator